MTSVLKRTKVLLSSEGQGQNYGTALNASHPRTGSDIDVERIADDRDERRAKGGLRRGLSARQVQMIAIGGTIGTGLFLGTGRSLAQGGPASLLICYALVGFIVYVTLLLLGEMGTQYPVAGECLSFSRSCTRALLLL